jgi:hypothetical protein
MTVVPELLTDQLHNEEPKATVRAIQVLQRETFRTADRAKQQARTKSQNSQTNTT